MKRNMCLTVVAAPVIAAPLSAAPTLKASPDSTSLRALSRLP